jgi:hypothetical protein
MTIFYCRTCGDENELHMDMPDGWFWCDNDCFHRFRSVVRHLLNEGDPVELDLEPGSRLVAEAVKEVHAIERAEAVRRREVAEREYDRTRPRPLPPIYPV